MPHSLRQVGDSSPFRYGEGGAARFRKSEVDFVYGRSEEIVNQALASALTALPPLQSRELFPPRYGYDRTPLTIEDVITTDRQPGPDYRYDYSGTRGSYMGTSRPGLGMV